MLQRTRHLELYRRVTAYYLLFGLAAIAWLAVGAVVTAVAILESRTEGQCLTRLGDASNALRLASVRSPEQVQPLVEMYRQRCGLIYCAVVGEDGRFLAHSSPECVGQSHLPATGEAAHWGDAERVRYIAPDSRVLREYRTPIRSHGQPWGTLVMAVADTGIGEILLEAAEHAPAAFLCPMLLVGLGALTLRRTVAPITAIEEQLQEMAEANSLEERPLRTVDSANRIGAGWNRLVAWLEEGRRRRGSEDHLAQALEGFRQRKSEYVLQSLCDGVAVTDSAGRISFANRAFLGLFGAGGVNPGACGRKISECLDLESAGPAAQPLLDAGLHERTVVAEIRRAQGAVQSVLRVVRSPLTAGPGESPTGQVWSVRDITQQKLADQMRDQFVNSATHELRTPLANIKAYAETLALSEMIDVEQQKAFCNTINDEATRLGRFVDDLLHLSRMEAGSTSLSQQVTNMDRLLREVIQKVRPQMDAKRIRLDAELPAKLPELVIDKDKIAVGLVNLLGNAAKYTPEGGQVRMQVHLKEHALQIAVDDSGIGIAVEELPKVFDKFFRSSDPRVLEQTGSGLGLSLTHEIVRLHGGKLSVESELNKGSTFTMTLPV